MGWRQDWLRRRAQEKEADAELFKRHRAFSQRRGELRRRQFELSERLHRMRRAGNAFASSSPEGRRLAEELAAVRSELHDIEIQRHLRSYGDEDEMYDRYYRHIRHTRPFLFAFNAALWGLLFVFGGASLGLKILIAFLAVTTTAGTVYEMLFLLHIKDRILVPVDRLRRAVRSVAEGQFEIEVENKSSSEISGLITAFNRMARKLHENELLQTEYENNRKALISNISHDLKTPMTSIEGYVEALLSETEPPPEKRARYLKIIQSNSAYMNRLVDDLFLFSTLDLQKLEFHFRPTPVRPFLRDMMEEFQLDLEERGVAFRYEDALDGEYTADLDAKRFHQILQNLVGNAVKHGPKQGLRIDAAARVQSGRLLLSVRDNGPGIPAQALPHLFERFYRAEPERTKDLSSTGLGLAIAKELTQAHGGDISAESEEGRGSCFTVAVPCRAQAEADTNLL